jgi:hypothetical protein
MSIGLFVTGNAFENALERRRALRNNFPIRQENINLFVLK